MYTAHQRPRFFLFHALLACALLTISANAFAHKVNMFAFVEGDQVFVEGYFSDGKRAQNSTVIVYDENGKELLQGQTTHEGSFSFRVPKAKELLVTLNAGMGHKAEYLLSKEELAGVFPGETEAGDTLATKDEGQAAQPADSMASNTGSGEPAESGGVGRVNELAIRRAVGQAILPLMRSVSALEERSSFSDIIGGIGFIVGIGGLFFYYKARKMMREMGAANFRNPGPDR